MPKIQNPMVVNPSGGLSTFYFLSTKISLAALPRGSEELLNWKNWHSKCTNFNIYIRIKILWIRGKSPKLKSFEIALKICCKYLTPSCILFVESFIFLRFHFFSLYIFWWHLWLWNLYLLRHHKNDLLNLDGSIFWFNGYHESDLKFKSL